MIIEHVSDTARWVAVYRAMETELILAEIARRDIDCVLNLAAGLDARPFRLTLPAELRWIDVDFAPILDHKWDVLKDETSSCLYETAPTDLTDGDARRALFARVSAAHCRRDGVLCQVRMHERA